MDEALLSHHLLLLQTSFLSMIVTLRLSFNPTVTSYKLIQRQPQLD